MSVSPVTPLAFIGNFGVWEWGLIILIGLLVFGRRLPEVGRSLGRSIVEFKKGVKGIEDEVNGAVSESERREAERRRLAEESQRTPYEGPKPTESRTIPTTDEAGGSGNASATTSN